MSLDFSLFYKIEEKETPEVFSKNITGNLAEMADKAGLHEALWRPKENGFEKAADISGILLEGLNKLKSDPEFYSKFNSKNGWGTHEHFVLFVEAVLDACLKYKNAYIASWI